MSKLNRISPVFLGVAILYTYATARAQSDFGSVAVGSSTSETITVTVTKASSFTAVNVVTWGAAGLDFTALSGGTCAAGMNYGAGQTCTVNVQFKPQYAGQRLGAVTLANPGANTFATTFLKGTGTGAQVAFLPGTATAIYPTLNGYPLAPNKSSGVAIDGAGTLSIASPVLDSSGNNIAQGGFLQIPSGSSVATLIPATGDNPDDPANPNINPVAVRVDGAGDRLLNDQSYTISLPPGASVGTEMTIGNSTDPAVDGKGNIYLFNMGGLSEYSPTMFDGNLIGSIAGGVVSVNGRTLSGPSAEATDAAGDVYLVGRLDVQDSSNEPESAPIVEVTASQLADTHNCCGQAQPIEVTANGVALQNAADVVFDGAGDMLLADFDNNRVVEVPAGGGAAFAFSPIVDGKGLKAPKALALDSAGNLYILDAGNARVVKVTRSQQFALTFATTPVDTVSSDGAKSVVVQNAGTSPLTFSSIVFPADFPAQTGGTNACSTSTPLAPGSSCNLNVTFKPQTAGPLSESVVITDNTLNQSGTTQSFSVSGTGNADELVFSSTSLSFGSQPVGYSTATQTVTLTNNGSAVTFLSIALTGASAGSFVSTNTCAPTLAANSTCNVGVRFVPTATGGATAALTLTDNAGESPQSIALNGTGTTAPASSLVLSATSLAFGSEPVGSSTASQNVNVTNTSANTLYFKSIVLGGTGAASFVTSNTCGVSLAAGATCRIGVRFAPTATGAFTASVTLTDNASPSTQSISVSGTGLALTLSASSLSFGQQYVGIASVPRSVTLTNTSHAAITVNSIAPTGADVTSFGLSNTCGTSLAAGAACNLAVTMNPTKTGPLAASITITYNGSSSQAVAVGGTGIITLNLSPTSIAFGNQAVGSSTATQTIGVYPYGAITFTSISLTGPNAGSFVTSNTCGTSPGGMCRVGVRFVPTTTGPATASITFVDNATDPVSPQTVTLTGTGVTPAAATVSLSSSSLSFGNETVGTSTATQNVTVTNTSSVVLYFKSIALSGANASSFVTSNTCGASLAAGANCRIGVRFVPQATGAATAAITLTDNASTSPQTLTLSGTGQ